MIFLSGQRHLSRDIDIALARSLIKTGGAPKDGLRRIACTVDTKKGVQTDASAARLHSRRAGQFHLNPTTSIISQTVKQISVTNSRSVANGPPSWTPTVSPSRAFCEEVRLLRIS